MACYNRLIRNYGKAMLCRSSSLLELPVKISIQIHQSVVLIIRQYVTRIRASLSMRAILRMGVRIRVPGSNRNARKRVPSYVTSRTRVSLFANDFTIL